MGAVLAAVLAGCGTSPAPEPQPSYPKPAPSPSPTPSRPAPRPAEPAAEDRGGILPAPSRPRSAEELRLQAAKRLVAANPSITYTGKPPELLLAIPVISIELNADGSVKAINVLRRPSQARDTEDIARAAILRAAPFGDVSALPKPWKFTETFLFNSDRKFKPMTLDQIK
jgi:outer membrane biosynthesis protein TonB